MSTPYEVLAGPLTVWVAPTGTTFPVTSSAPSGSWFKLGTSGTKNYDEKGVTVTPSQTIAEWYAAGGTGARKAFRTQESLMVEFDLVDMTPEQYAMVMNNASVSTQTGPPATKTISLQQGLTVSLFALLARGLSPVNDSLPAQYQVPLVYQSSSPALVYAKGTPVAITCQFKALEDPSTGFGTLVTQTA